METSEVGNVSVLSAEHCAKHWLPIFVNEEPKTMFVNCVQCPNAPYLA